MTRDGAAPGDCPGWLAVVIGLAVGMAYAVALFGPGVAFGWAEYWDLPRGLQGGRFDMSGVLAAWHWYLREPWGWPLLAISKANAPHGSNAALFDAIPLLLVGTKLWHGLTGWVWNPYPLWQSGCFALNAAALVVLVRTLGARSLAAALLAAGIGAMAPMVHLRQGHLALLAHWLPIFALALYVHVHGQARVTAAWMAVLVGLCAVSSMVNLYLFVMVGAITVAATLQAAFDRRCAWALAIPAVIAMPAAGAMVTWATGMLDIAAVGRSSYEFGRNSMNLLAPFWPQSSGALAWTNSYWLTRGSIGATAGQYDGFSYAGLAALLLMIGAVALDGRRLALLVRRNWVLALALALLTAWALSNRIHAGGALVLSYPVPRFLEETVLSWFRASGRMFWPAAWLLVALAIAVIMRRASPRLGMVVAVVALGVQWADLSIWRQRIAGQVAVPTASVFGPADTVARLRKYIAAHGHVGIVPPALCADSAIDPTLYANAGSEAQLLAARANATIAWIGNAREATECRQTDRVDLTGLAARAVLIVLRDAPGLDRTEDARRIAECVELAVGAACTPRQ